MIALFAGHRYSGALRDSDYESPDSVHRGGQHMGVQESDG
jgi:hypothetical protein